MTKTALITGAAKRIGQAMVHHLAGQDWNIAIHCHNSEKEAFVLRTELQNRYPGQQFEIFKADLNQPDEVESLIPRVIQKMPGLVMLVNNASIFEKGCLIDTSTPSLGREMNVNFIAPFILIRHFAQLVEKGNIVNFVDTRITKNNSDYSVYTLSKKALWELTKMAAHEFGPTIRVNAIAPGLTLPPEDKDDDYLWKLARGIPMKRPGGLEPVLKSLDYILDNDFLTGQLLFCDGGENLGKTS